MNHTSIEWTHRSETGGAAGGFTWNPIRARLKGANVSAGNSSTAGAHAMRAFLYARVSAADKGQDVENQLAELRRFALAQGWEIVHVYIDHETGSISDRVELKAMMLACSQHKADVVLFWALDRLTREGVLPTLQYLNTLTSYGVGFKSFTEQYLDSCGIFKEAVISILATIAKQERQRLRERTIAGMARARANGARFGRPKVNVDHAVVASFRAAGRSLRWIATELHISEGSVRNALKSTARPRKKGVGKQVSK